jgi:hypothetical protein
LREFENRILRRIFGPKGEIAGENCIMRSFRCNKWEDNIQIDIRELRCEGIDWIYRSKDKIQCQFLVNTIMNL